MYYTIEELSRMLTLFVFCLALLAQDVRSQTSKCCPDLGCYDSQPPFDMMPLPDCPEEFSTSIHMYTRFNPEVGHVIDRTTIPPTYDPSRRTVLIVHGWLGSDNNNWMERMKDDMLAQGDYNVVMVGWQGSSVQLWYPQSASDTRTVGDHLSSIVDNLIAQTGASASSFYCTGHSLGSHVCGHLGHRTKIGRITGMDPAGPLFEDEDWSVGLNPNAADFVDIMHTHGERSLILNLGTMRILGHVDFYPNGGDRQPGCILDPLTIQPVGEDFGDLDLTPACSHMRALDYFEHSILEDCFISRYNCSDVHDLPDSCWEHFDPIQSMGFHADQWPRQTGSYYLPISSDRPYCEH